MKTFPTNKEVLDGIVIDYDNLKIDNRKLKSRIYLLEEILRTLTKTNPELEILIKHVIKL